MEKKIEKKFRNLAYLIGYCTFAVFLGVPAIIFFVFNLVLLAYHWSNSLFIPSITLCAGGWLMIILFFFVGKQEKPASLYFFTVSE